ncbi:hypothetical protein HPB51_010280 [Rhipicephalus microplus]|uniref:CCHC-type domain-containing protein n=1 Tax=Rhipicephalus microplus TaxID=6941 RepID=A0A9J6D4Y8_RHIMP|nr:hypothetical protein HPB51_010280 [Rhipicephalus microplus]
MQNCRTRRIPSEGEAERGGAVSTVAQGHRTPTSGRGADVAAKPRRPPVPLVQSEGARGSGTNEAAEPDGMATSWVLAGSQTRVVNVITASQPGVVRTLSRTVTPGTSGLSQRPNALGLRPTLGSGAKPNVIVVHKAQVWPQAQPGMASSSSHLSRSTDSVTYLQRQDRPKTTVGACGTVTVVKTSVPVPQPCVAPVVRMPRETTVKTVPRLSVPTRKPPEQTSNSSSTGGSTLGNSGSNNNNSSLLAEVMHAAGIFQGEGGSGQPPPLLVIGEDAVPPAEVEVAIDTVPVDDNAVILDDGQLLVDSEVVNVVENIPGVVVEEAPCLLQDHVVCHEVELVTQPGPQLEGGTKLWWWFMRGFDSWEQFTAAFCSKFSSIDAKRRLKAELEQCTQHPEENLKEFIYAVATFYNRIREEVSKPRRCSAYRGRCTLSCKIWRRGMPTTTSPTALDPSYCRDRQYSCDTAPPFSPYGPGPTPRQEPTSGAMRVQCHHCGGFGHISRNCATGRRMGPPVCFRCQRSGHLQAQCPGNQWRCVIISRTAEIKKCKQRWCVANTGT